MQIWLSNTKVSRCLCWYQLGCKKMPFRETFFLFNIEFLVFTWRHLTYSHRWYLSSMSIHININCFLPFRMMSQVIFIIQHSEVTNFEHEWERELQFSALWLCTWKRLRISGLDPHKTLFMWLDLHLCKSTFKRLFEHKHWRVPLCAQWIVPIPYLFSSVCLLLHTISMPHA